MFDPLHLELYLVGLSLLLAGLHPSVDVAFDQHFLEGGGVFEEALLY